MATVEFFGETFELRPKVSQYALAKFAKAVSKSKTGEDVMRSMASMYDLVERCVTAEDWDRFDETASANDASFEELTAVLAGAFQSATERPTSLPSDSSDGQKIIAPSVASSSADKGLDRLAGRPDLQLAVLHTRAG